MDNETILKKIKTLNKTMKCLKSFNFAQQKCGNWIMNVMYIPSSAGVASFGLSKSSSVLSAAMRNNWMLRILFPKFL